MEEILKRHRKEARDLQNQITGMKKQATKSTRKEVNSKCEQLKSDLDRRHSEELREVDQSGVPAAGEEQSTDGQVDEVTPEQLLAQLNLENKPPKEEKAPGQPQEQPTRRRRNRQKEKLARRDAEVEKMKEQARREAAVQPDLAKLERQSLSEVCAKLHLHQYDIKPDGHCLFASILDQLQQRHPDTPQGWDVYKLRALACQYIRDHADDFVPYLFDENTMSVRDVDEYTTEMETTAVWGGEIEILALAKALDCPISVLISGSATHRVNEQGQRPELKIVYYKHGYSLGEHYNSLRDAPL
ncbi:deubiquitinase OTU2 KNAG_0C05610 [Huiozyma naganishii CBS 8797]|uniref:OTU domain-containing protein n=1 Tax=Huiozyma naganishii (strain ATCC MYA-139 / BCRC 22969 / CBS 8797 / KCTC 17520 / NBRC 10181 / NCYC 3082 / Yp74L-3) TaxID=1071383 RepID=J7S547_HUIN7|nr:hypothetical protein KNAG_0C05610 [Kazachstania naganishii CBS 8797]CCK69659.1 hypothetical protein KNAG_0C05610 [Kazachstania naganishii CBS 8797]